MKRFKLRFYHKSGGDKGCLSHEEFFDTLEQLNDRYEKVFVYLDFSLNPTAWELGSNNEWHRIYGY